LKASPEALFGAREKKCNGRKIGGIVEGRGQRGGGEIYSRNG